MGIIVGRSWLDCGSADGGYSIGLVDRGARRVVGIDPIAARIDAARRAGAGRPLDFFVHGAENLPFQDGTFDGVLLNEVLEHVTDERQTSGELWRVLVPGGYLALFSPNRWFPFEAHGISVCGRELRFPVLEVYPGWFRRIVPILERMPGIRRFGVSSFIVARRP